MFRTDVATASATLPTPLAAGTQGFFTNGNPDTGTPATVVDADWANMVQEELYAIVLAAGLTPSKTVRTQVRDGIAALYLAKAGGTLTGAVGVIAGSAASPGIFFSGDTNTGIFSPGADNISMTTAGVERRRTDSTGNVSSFIVGQTGLYPEFGCRAWVNFNGNSGGAVRGSGNVAITRTATGTYSGTFTTPMPDANWAMTGFAGLIANATRIVSGSTVFTKSASSFAGLTTRDGANNANDSEYLELSFFR